MKNIKKKCEYCGNKYQIEIEDRNGCSRCPKCLKVMLITFDEDAESDKGKYFFSRITEDTNQFGFPRFNVVKE